jgi:ribosomal protein S8
MVVHILSDLVSRINVASRKRLSSIKVIKTIFSLKILQVLLKNGFIFGIRVYDDYILIFLKYSFGRPMFRKLQVVSKPSKRVFFTLNHLSLKYRYNSFCGFFIISTPKGLITSADSLLGLNISGEILLKVDI